MTLNPAPAPIEAPTPLPAANEATRATPRICVECGGEFYPPAKGPGQHKKFCDAKGKGVCKQAFANREKVQGAALVTIAKVYAATRHGRTDEHRRLRVKMRTEMTRILSHFIGMDRRDGRLERLLEYSNSLVNVDTDYHERRRKN